MPHFIIECSENITQQKSPEEIVKVVYDAAESSGLFDENDVKVRITPYKHYQIGEDKEAFIHVFGNVMEGRTIEQRADLSKRIIEALDRMFPDISILSINIREFEKATYYSKAFIER